MEEKCKYSKVVLAFSSGGRELMSDVRHSKMTRCVTYKVHFLFGFTLEREPDSTDGADLAAT